MKRILISIFLLLFAAPAFGAVAYDNSATVTGVGVTSISIALSITGSNTLVIQSMAIESTTVLSASQNSVATAQKSQIVLTAGQGEMWFKVGVTSGSCAAVFNAAANISLACISFNGVDQTTPLGSASTQAAFGTSIACTVPTSGLCVDTLAEVGGTGAAHTVGGSQTKLVDVFDGSRSAVGTSTISGSATMTWDNTGGYEGAISVPINAAAAGSTRRRVGPVSF